MTEPVPSNPQPPPPAPPRKKYVRAVGPRLRVLLGAIFALFALLSANSLYLATITFLEWAKGLSYQNYFYQYMFLLHLGLGLLIVLPVVVFGIAHIYNAANRPNKRAVRVGYALFTVALILLFSGIALTRMELLRVKIDIKSPTARNAIYWAHVVTPLLAGWLYVIHRLAGPRIKWKVGLRWGAVTAVLVAGMAWFNFTDPRQWSVVGPKEGEKYFFPSLARTASGNFISADTLMMDQYCLKCHQDNYKGWFHSAHHFSSFNNKPYLFSVRETRKVALERDGNVRAARWCAGCHDTVPFFSGAFDDPKFDDVNHPTAQAGITCTTCHAITAVNSTRGNGDYTIDEPIHYPFAKSDNAVLQWVNNQLVKAKPAFHKKTFLKPLHQTAEFCSTCHKVSIPRELNHYKDFLRGQNHYDTFLLSGVSGHNARSFYYPPKAETNCNGCHMPTLASNDFGAKFFDSKNPNVLSVHNHLFPAANTGLAHINGFKDTVKAHADFLKGTLRVDIFGVKEGGTIDGPLTAPLRPTLPALKPGKTYLIEVVLRTLKLGHPFTQGTVDSNEVWVDVTATNAQSKLATSLESSSPPAKVIGRSGGLGKFNSVDPWSHFVNVYMLDRDGNRIDRRNPQDIFTPLYNHQIPPGAAAVVHYALKVPDDQKTPLTVDVKLQYRKFDTTYMHHVFGKEHVNDLPITTIAADRVTFPIEGADPKSEIVAEKSEIPEWQRWNDYGIGLLLQGDKGSEKGELVQAAAAFAQVEKLGKADGPLNLARVYVKEGRLNEAVEALGRALRFDPPAPRWTVAWLNGLVNKQNGFLDEAIKELTSVLEDRYPEIEQRGFDFSKDYEVINELGQVLFERAKLERGEARNAQRDEFLRKAEARFKQTLALDSENATAHYTLALVYGELGDAALAAEHRKLHERFRPDDNARDRAIAIARRRDAAADHAAQAVVIYPLHRPVAPGLAPPDGATPPEKSEQLQQTADTDVKQPPMPQDTLEDQRRQQDVESPGEEWVSGDDRVIGRAVKWSMLGLAIALGGLGAAWYWAHRKPPAPPPRVTTINAPVAPKRAQAQIPDVRFTDVTKQSGIDFVHVNGASGDKFLPETMGGGVAFVDFDGDDDQDLLFVNGTTWSVALGANSGATSQPAPQSLVAFANDGNGRFTRLTNYGLDASFYGMGVAVGDYDNDGRTDVFATGVGGYHLFRNLGDGKFQDVTQSAGVRGDKDDWGTSAAFFDYDNDSKLDLFVCNYIRWSPQIDREVGYSLTGIGRAYGPPTNFQGAFSCLYHNRGDGTFEDVSAKSGIQVKNTNSALDVAAGKSLGVCPVDLDNDGWLDLVVANDTVQNFVFRNKQDGTFEEVGAETGIAFDSYGNARGAMGIDAARHRNDSTDTLAIGIGNFANEMTALYVSKGSGGAGEILFTDDAIPEGVGPASRLLLKFGLFFFDYDLDGWQDLLTANGHLEEEIHKVQASQQYAQPAQLFWNGGASDAGFIPVPADKAGADLFKPIVGRGSAYGDIDGDGDLDVVLTQIAGPPLLLRNDQSLGRHFLRLKLVGAAANRDAVGAQVRVKLGGQTIWRQVMPTRGYLSQSELPITIGLGSATKSDAVDITWPGGKMQTLSASEVKLDALTVVEQPK